MPVIDGRFVSGKESWMDTWLGHQVSFILLGNRIVGEVVSAERFYLGNGIHDILEIEVFDPKQIKIQVHRQACKRLD
jgi:hypothetical protein